MSDKYTRSAEGQLCQIRIPGHCCHDPTTVVFCHLNGAGIGRKHANILGAYGCHRCHSVVDGREPTEYSPEEVKLMHLQGMVRTIEIMIREGTLRL